MHLNEDVVVEVAGDVYVVPAGSGSIEIIECGGIEPSIVGVIGPCQVNLSTVTTNIHQRREIDCRERVNKHRLRGICVVCVIE